MATFVNQAIVKKRGFTSFYSKGEEIFNAVTHIVGGGLGLIFWVITLCFAYPNPVHMTAVSVFGASIVILYTMSALYHFLPNGRAKGVFRIFDHCTIFLLIAGTYTPYCMIALWHTPVGIWVLAIEWICAVAGITMKAIALNNKVIKSIAMAMYLIMGWLAVAVIPAAVKVLNLPCMLLVLFGGIAYTVGIVFYALGKKVKYFHAIWHLFVLAGTVLQFVSILFMLL